MRKNLYVFLLSIVFMNTAVADEPSGITISPMVGQTWLDNVKDDLHGALGIGYQFQSPWAIELMYVDMSSELEGGSVDADVKRWHLDGLYHLQPWKDKLVPYLSFGVGQAEIEAASFARDETLYNLGAGVKFHFSEATSLRGDIKFFEAGDVNMNSAVSIGLHHVFGSRRAVAAAPAPEPVKSPARPTPKVIDTDGDGVADTSDACPETPAGVPVNERGCTPDDDGDGVANYLDACPDTTDRQARLTADGCYVVLSEKVRIRLNVEFDLNSSFARADHRPEVERVYNFMREYPQTRVTIEGHTDSTGSDDYNKFLSQRRANTIANILINSFGISADRVEAVGYGEERPIAGNETKDGRQKNRRVVGVIEADVNVIQKQR